MKITVQKGTEEIGGSCIKLETKHSIIFLDYGSPLKENSKQKKIDCNVDGILISHPHQDHFGEIEHIDLTIPIYCGELSRELMNATKIFTGGTVLKNKFETFKAKENFSIGDFTITPYLVDHSAVDSYAFLVEANNKKILYSGDFRANGRKSKLFDIMIRDNNLKNVDVLLMEGTMLKRNNDNFPDENSVEDKMYQNIKDYNQISFMIGSSQNIDSIVSAYRACIKANKIFVIDMYTAWILEKLKLVSNSTPNMNWENVKVIKKFGGSYYKKIKENKDFFKNFQYEIFNNVIEIEDIKKNPSSYFLKVSPWHIEKILNDINIADANIIYSQWLGYLKEEFSSKGTVSLFNGLKEKYNFVYAHTSGHADLDALKEFASSINPKKLIPIHTEYKDEFQKHFDNVFILEDNEVFDLFNDTLTTYQ